MINETLTGGLTTPSNEDKLVRLAIIASHLKLSSKDTSELLARANQGIDETPAMNDAIYAMETKYTMEFSKAAAAFGSAVAAVFDVPATIDDLRRSYRKMKDFEGATEAEMLATYTAEEASNAFATRLYISSLVTYFNYFAQAAKVPVII